MNLEATLTASSTQSACSQVYLLKVPEGGYLLSSTDGWSADSAPLPGNPGDFLWYRAGGHRWLDRHRGAADAGARSGRASFDRGSGRDRVSAGAGHDAAAVLGARQSHRPAPPVPVRAARFPGRPPSCASSRQSRLSAGGAGDPGARCRRGPERIERADPLDLSGKPARPRPRHRQCRGRQFERDRADARRPGALGGDLALDLRRRRAARIAVAAARPARAARADPTRRALRRAGRGAVRAHLRPDHRRPRKRRACAARRRWRRR